LEASKKNTQDLTKELNDEKAKLSDIEKASGKTSKEYQEQAKKVKDLENSVKASENENQRMAKAMQDVRIKMNETETACNRTKQQIDNLGKATKEAGENAQEANGGWSIFKGVVANLATSAIQSAINGLKQLGQAALDIGKQALSSYSDYEQLKGGVETLFGDDTAKIVERNAQNAFKTAGLSANQYMETVTSFSASLLKSVGGDTEKAAKIADKAITDMADNANKMGSSIDSIQNAYAGFAKGNYTIDLMSVA
jgi:predicted RNase H-like nuclease (RuvC/YqgF family)